MATTSSEISERIAILTNAYQEVTTQIDRLSNLTAPGTEEARNELAGLIHQSLKEGDAELETLTLRTSTLNPSTDPQAALQSRLHKLQEELKLARVSYRKSLLQSKRTSALNARKEREALLILHPPTIPTPPSTTPSDNANEQSLPLPHPTSASPPPLTGAQLYRRPYHTSKRDKKDLTQQDLVSTASSDVTTALRRTHALMSAELARSHFAYETLSASTETLKHLGTNYSAFDNVLQRSKGLITDLVKKNKSDMWYYQMSLYALVVTIAWLVFRRLLWGPVYLVVWLPLRLVVWIVMMPFKVPPGESAVGESKGGSVSSSGVSEVTVGRGLSSEVKKVVESMTVSQRVEGEDGKEEVVVVKKIILDNGEEVEVPLDVPDGVIEGMQDDDVSGEGEDVETEEHYEAEAEAGAVHDEL